MSLGKLSFFTPLSISYLYFPSCFFLSILIKYIYIYMYINILFIFQYSFNWTEKLKMIILIKYRLTNLKLVEEL